LNSTTLNALSGNLTEQYVNGIGLVYQRDFDTFGEFIRNFFRSGSRRTAPVNPTPVPPTTKASPPTPAVKPDDEEQ